MYKKIFTTIGAVLLALFIVGGSFSLIALSNEDTVYETNLPFTMCQFEGIKTGMSLEVAENAVFQRPGQHTFSYKANSGTDPIDVYEWHDRLGGTILIKFRDGVMVDGFSDIMIKPEACKKI